MRFLNAIVLASLFSFSIQARDKVVYGEDNRKDVFESPSALYKKLAESTAAMIPVGYLSKNADGSIRISGQSLEEMGVCSNERFVKQPTPANCSAFLVGDQHIVTAGHCIETIVGCSNYSWVFNFGNAEKENREYKVSEQDVYSCTGIISRVLDRSTQNDYAFLKLDRKVVGRAPLKFRKSGKIGNSQDLVVIGHPSGLPTKIADGAKVRSNSNKIFFQTNLDTFGGNSGSAVFDSKTGVVEGILVRGETDYVQDSTENCIRPKICEETGCRGEDVTRITNIKELMKLKVK